MFIIFSLKSAMVQTGTLKQIVLQSKSDSPGSSYAVVTPLGHMLVFVYGISSRKQANKQEKERRAYTMTTDPKRVPFV